MEFQLSAFKEYQSGRARRILKVQLLEGKNSFSMRLPFFTPQKLKLRPDVYT